VKTIVFVPAAAKQFDRLPTVAQVRIMDGLADYAVHGTGDVKRLSNRPGYRLRIGSYRVMFDEDRVTILALYVGTRATDTGKRN
jgi:mRNA interferase RelE/StbE